MSKQLVPHKASIRKKQFEKVSNVINLNRIFRRTGIIIVWQKASWYEFTQFTSSMTFQWHTIPLTFLKPSATLDRNLLPDSFDQDVAQTVFLFYEQISTHFCLSRFLEQQVQNWFFSSKVRDICNIQGAFKFNDFYAGHQRFSKQQLYEMSSKQSC